MIDSINSHPQTVQINPHQPESVGEREHDGDSDGAMRAAQSAPQQQIQFGKDQAAHINIMA